MLKIKQIIKDKYWIVESGYGKVGTVRKLDNGFEYFNQDNNTKELLPNLDSFKETVVAETTGINQEYKGFPTNTPVLFPVEDETRALFKKAKDGKTIFVAGYYILKYDGMGWQHAFCHKLETLDKYEHRGPYLTEWAMNLNLKKARQE